MKRHPARLVFAACAALLLAACGQKGPLYLPGDPSEIRTEIPQPAGTDTADDTDEADGAADAEADDVDP